jgi:hypothetical protein
MQIYIQVLMKKIWGVIYYYENTFFAHICSCTNKIEQVAVKGAKMAVILGWSGSEGLSRPGNTDFSGTARIPDALLGNRQRHHVLPSLFAEQSE